MNLSAPTMMVFIISVVLVAISLLPALGILSLPVSAYWIGFIGYVVLLAGNVLKGI